MLENALNMHHASAEIGTFFREGLGQGEMERKSSAANIRHNAYCTRLQRLQQHRITTYLVR